MRTGITSLAALFFVALLSAMPAQAQSTAPLTVTAMVENQVCLSKDFVQVTFSATATSDSQPVGFKWDFNNDGRPDTRLSTDPTATQVFPDESAVTTKIVALNKAGERAQDSISFATLKCR